MALRRIRMRSSIVYFAPDAQLDRAFAAGQVLDIPRDLDRHTAEAWIKAGLAVEDKLGEGPRETKRQEARDGARG